jgi:hypothetical protein
MFTRISNSWELVKASFAVLRADKELLIFPVVAFLASLVVMATFAVPMLLAGFFDSVLSGDANGVLSVIIGFLFYLVMYFVTIFFNSALAGAAAIRLDGGDPTLADGFRIAGQHIGHILGYAAIAATVGMILRAISERGGIVGRIVSSILGFAWGVVPFLVVPILGVVGIGPVDAGKGSAALLRRTWGEQLVGNFGIGAIFGLLFLGVIVVGIPLIILAASAESVALVLLVVALMILAFIVLGLLSSTLSAIYSVAVYRYAVDGNAGEFFPSDLVQGAFRTR